MTNRPVDRPGVLSGVSRTLFVAACLSAPFAQSADITWTGGGGDHEWLNPANWSSNPNLPVEGSGNDSVLLDTVANHAIFDVADGTRVYRAVRVGYNADGRLDVTGGTLQSTDTVQHRIGRGGHAGTLNISGSGSVVAGHIAQLGLDFNSVGVVNISDAGRWQITRGLSYDIADEVSLVVGAGGDGLLTISDKGRVYTRFGVLLGQTTAFQAARYHVDGGTSLSRIGGNNGANPSNNGFWIQRPAAILQATVDTAGHLGTIDIYDASGSGGSASFVTFDANSVLDPGFSGAPVAGSWDLMTFSDNNVLTDNGLTLDPADAAAGWSFAFVDTGGAATPNVLRITYSGAAAPAPPVARIKMPGNEQVQLVWSPSSNATGYIVRAGTTSGGPYTLTNHTAATNATITGLVNGVTYYFSMSAVNALGEGSPAAEISTKPLLTEFVHPGGLHTQTDLDRMKTKVAASAEPWLSGWNKLIANPHAQLTWTPNPQPDIYRGDDGVHAQNYSILYNDIAAAYQCALRYHVSGDSDYADKAVEIMNAWAGTLTNIAGTSDRFLASGIYGYQFANVGEMMRHYPGWSAADFAQFQALMLNVFYPMNHDFLVNHNYSCISHYWANWDLCNMASILSVGVLCDDPVKFDEAVDYFKTGPGNGSIGHASYYMHPGHLCQWQESGRDQGHATLGMALMGPLCEVAWNQGTDLYGYAGNRFLAGSEYVAKYNLFNTVPYVTYNNCDGVNQTVISSSGRGSVRPCWEMIYNHYVNRMGLTAPYSQQFAANIRPEGGGGDYGPNSGGYDQLGFGTLTYTRDPSGATPPAAPNAPTGLTATPDNCGVVLSWTPPAGATSYNVMRSTNSGGPYTTLVALEVSGTTCADTTAINGAPLYYVASANNAGGESPFSIQASTTFDGEPLPSPWSSQDVGTVGTPGDTIVCVDSNVWTLRGAGSNIGGTSDSCQFAYVSLAGDGEIIARIKSLETGGTVDDKVGLMARQSTAANARNYSLYVDANLGWTARTSYRSSPGGSTTAGASGPSVYPPQWLRISRINLGTLFTSYISDDGIGWTLLETKALPGWGTVQVGLFVCSRDTNALDTSVFDHVSVGGVWEPPLSFEPPAIRSSYDSGQVEITWPPDRVGWRLESQTNGFAAGMGTNWFPVAGSTETNRMFFTPNPADNAVFFRLVWP